MALLSKIIFAAAIAVAKAQSSDPGIGSNPNAQGATEEVTPGSGPNGYSLPFHGSVFHSN